MVFEKCCKYINIVQIILNLKIFQETKCLSSLKHLNKQIKRCKINSYTFKLYELCKRQIILVIVFY